MEVLAALAVFNPTRSPTLEMNITHCQALIPLWKTKIFNEGHLPLVLARSEGHVEALESTDLSPSSSTESGSSYPPDYPPSDLQKQTFAIDKIIVQQ